MWMLCLLTEADYIVYYSTGEQSIWCTLSGESDALLPDGIILNVWIFWGLNKMLDISKMSISYVNRYNPVLSVLFNEN